MSDFFKSFKEKHIKHTLLYKYYRVLKYAPPKAFGGYAEDCMLRRIYRMGPYKKARYKGVYVDVGCNHPIVGNTTYNLYKMGWKGLNLDLTANNILLCQKLRARDISVQCAISEEVGEIETYIFDEGSGMNTLDKEAADKAALHLKRPYNIGKINSMPLNMAIEENLGRQKIDVLNVDVEGHEMSVLKSFDFETYSPDLITCEIHGKTIEDMLAHEVYAFILSKGYYSFSRYGATTFFARAGFEFSC